MKTIKREDLLRTTPVSWNFAGDHADYVAAQVREGHKVPIVGLGTLEGFNKAKSGLSYYRFFLTRTVEKACRIRFSGPGPVMDSEEGARMLEDVRHLARALEAPVEVWTPDSCAFGTKGLMGGDIVTTVQPK